MEVELSDQTIYAIARKTAMLLRQGLRSAIAQEYPKFVTTKEAAEILHITPGRLRKIADRYPHVKKGEHKQAKLLFVRDGLFK